MTEIRIFEKELAKMDCPCCCQPIHTVSHDIERVVRLRHSFKWSIRIYCRNQNETFWSEISSLELEMLRHGL